KGEWAQAPTDAPGSGAGRGVRPGPGRRLPRRSASAAPRGGPATARHTEATAHPTERCARALYRAHVDTWRCRVRKATKLGISILSAAALLAATPTAALAS